MTAFRRLMHKSTPADTVVVSLFQYGEGVGARYAWAAAMHRAGPVAAFESEVLTPQQAVAEAEAAQERHGFPTLAVFLDDVGMWQPEWGTLGEGTLDGEPIGRVDATDLSSAETGRLAEGIERERDA